MARRGKGKRAKNIKPETAAKIQAIEKIREYFHVQAEEYEQRLNKNCVELCDKVHKVYMDRLKAIPENIRNMTISELMKLSEQEKKVTEPVDSLSCMKNNFERYKLLSEKKKTHKMSRLERKRSLSASACSVNKILSLPQPSRILSRCNSEAVLNTPLARKAAIPAHVITPKFNPKAPLNPALLRKPRIGEVLMSLSGSPLVNYVNTVPEKPGVTVPLMNGEILQITEDTEDARIESELIKKVGQETKMTLENIKKKLDKILQA